MSNKKEPNLRINFAYRILYDLLTVITPFITTPYISRVLGAKGIGIYSYTNSIITYFTLFAALGTMSYGSREIAQHRDSKEESSKLFWEIELMTVITSAISILLWLTIILFSTKYRIYFIASTPLLFATMFDISWFFTGFEKIKNIVVRNSICKIASIICLFIFVNNSSDVVVYIIINSIMQLVANLSMWTSLHGMISKVNFKELKIKKHFKETLIYFVPTIATSIYTVLDKTLIGIITNDNYQNGYYEQATKVLNIVKNLVFTSVNFVMGARIAYLFSKNKYIEIKQKINKSLNFIMLLGFGAMFGIIGIAKTFVPIFFGKGYEEVILLLYVMSPLIVIIGFSNCLGSQYYTPSGQRAKSAKFIIIGSIINLIINICLIPFMASIGATISSIIAEMTISILYIKNCNGFVTLSQIVDAIWKKFIAGVLMCVLMVMLSFSNINIIILLVVQVVVGIIAYVAILLLLRDKTLMWLISIAKEQTKKILGGAKND